MEFIPRSSHGITSMYRGLRSLQCVFVVYTTSGAFDLYSSHSTLKSDDIYIYVWHGCMTMILSFNLFCTQHNIRQFLHHAM